MARDRSYLTFLFMELIDVVRSCGHQDYFEIMSIFPDKFINDNVCVALVFIQNVFMRVVLFLPGEMLTFLSVLRLTLIAESLGTHS